MEENPIVTELLENELEAKEMGLRFDKKNVTNVNLANCDRRKKLWESWMESHPDSNKTWRMAKTSNSNTLRCQVPVILKEVSAIVKEKVAILNNDQIEEAEDGPANFPTLERSDSEISTISDIETAVGAEDATWIQN